MIKVCVQGLGFVGSATAVVVASAMDKNGQAVFDVTGIEINNEEGYKKAQLLNQGHFPFQTTDKKLLEKTSEACKRGNLSATLDEKAYADADYIIVALPLNISALNGPDKRILWEPFKSGIHAFAALMKPNCLVIVETTVPPGTCREIIYPILKEAFEDRGLKEEPLLAHSYERVMPGADYFNSIVHYYRCFAGIGTLASERCRAFLEVIIDTVNWPLTELSAIEGSEMAKLMENSYRAITIAMIEEWSEFAEHLNVNIYESINAIRKRESHSNIRQPGFGVGGYCLTKDPLFALQAAKEIYNIPFAQFPFCEMAVATNNYMPLRCLEKLKKELGSLAGKNILLLGVSYRQDIGDTRYSPAQIFAEGAEKAGAALTFQDPLVAFWPEMNLSIPNTLGDFNPALFDAIVLGVPHRQYREENIVEWLQNTNGLIFDACGLLNETEINALRSHNKEMFIVGRGKI